MNQVEWVLTDVERVGVNWGNVNTLPKDKLTQLNRASILAVWNRIPQVVRLQLDSQPHHNSVAQMADAILCVFRL
jgi:hypothetical protein